MPSASTASPTSLLAQDKSKLRREARERRREFALAESPAAAGEKAADNLLAAVAFPAGSVVSVFWPMGDEIDSRPLMHRLYQSGCRIGLPVVVEKCQPLVFRRWTPETRVVPGGLNTQIPGPDEPEVVPERLIVPLLAFDRLGYRLGYGGGFYDRTLHRLRQAGAVTAIGFAYAGQEIAAVPRGGFDQPVDWLATETFVRRVGRLQ